MSTPPTPVPPADRTSPTLGVVKFLRIRWDSFVVCTILTLGDVPSFRGRRSKKDLTITITVEESPKVVRGSSPRRSRDVTRPGEHTT